MDLWSHIVLGFSLLAEPTNILLCLVGVFLGTLVGVLPGLGPAATIALLLPMTFHLQPVASIIMLSGIYYGSKYGGSITAILLNIPGEADSVVTCFDGYQMALQGRAGPALGISAFGSFIAGTIGTIGLMLLAPTLSAFALRFGPPEIFALMCVAVILLIFLASGSAIKAFISAGIGIFLGTIGMDLFSQKPRFAFGIYSLYDGLGIVPVIMGMFGIAEVFENIEKGLKREIFRTKMSNLLPSLSEWKESIGAIFRGSFVGFFIGLLPGGGSVLSCLASYTIEKRVSKNPEQFGKGAIAGVAGPESANNATCAANFIPLLTLGIPCNSVMAVLFAALLISGLSPGPLLIKENPNMFWGVIASMYVGNVMLLVLNLPLIGLWVRFLKIPYSVMFPIILFVCVIGAYTVQSNSFDVLIMIIFGVFGYLIRKFEYEAAPLVMAYVLTPLIENALLRSLRLSGGSFMIFIERPIALTLMLVALILLVTTFLGKGSIAKGKIDE